MPSPVQRAHTAVFEPSHDAAGDLVDLMPCRMKFETERAGERTGSRCMRATSPRSVRVEGKARKTCGRSSATGDALRFERKREVNERVRRIDEGPADYAAEAAPHALRGLTERLTVVSRGTIRNEVALAIALARGAPVLQPLPKASRAQLLRGRPPQATRPSPSRATL